MTRYYIWEPYALCARYTFRFSLLDLRHVFVIGIDPVSIISSKMKCNGNGGGGAGGGGRQTVIIVL